MLRHTLLLTLLLLLGYGFWYSSDFKAIAAGVSLFLFGMIFLEDGFQAFTGGLLERVLHRTTDRLWKSTLFGVISTTIMQSSTLVSILAISFLSAGMIELTAGIGIIFGANLGTTTGAWLIAGFGLNVNISAYAMPLLVFGMVFIFQSSKELKGLGYTLAGIGFLFLGIHYIKEGVESFKVTFDLAQFALGGYAGLFLFCGIGIIATVVMQSSHASLVLIITALAAGQVTYDNGLALAIGANIGSTVTAIISALNANIQGKRLAGVHLLFNLFTGIVAILSIQQMQALVDGGALLLGIAAHDYTLKLALFHTLFNLLGVVLLYPFTPQIVRLLTYLLPEQKRARVEPQFLNDAVLAFPNAIIETLRKETIHLFESAFEVMVHGLNFHRHDIRSEADLQEVALRPNRMAQFDIDTLYEDRVKVLYGAIIEFISRAQGVMPAEENYRIYHLRNAARDIVEAVKDIKHMRKNMLIYINSDNLNIRREYNQIRIVLGDLLRQLDRLKGAQSHTALLQLDALKLQLEQNDAALNHDIDTFIREGKITARMATSLMNDASYAYDVARNLIEVGTTLLIHHHDDRIAAQKSMALSEDELQSVLQQS